jgi:methylmalonyl-CoA mutase N-terminal domain/subunit
VDPFGGAYAVEEMTDAIEAGARALLERIEAAGGTLPAIEAGIIQREIQDSAYKAQLAIDHGEAVVVGVNRFATGDKASIEVLAIDPEVERRQVERVRTVRASREAPGWRAALDAVAAAAKAGDNLVPPIVTAVEARATIGEISDTLRAVFGEHKEIDA